MEGLLPRLRDAHRATFDGSPFVHFLELGSLLADRVIIHQVMTDWDDITEMFRSQGILHSFTPSCIHERTFLLVVGRSVNRSFGEPLFGIGISKRPWEKKENNVGTCF